MYTFHLFLLIFSKIFKITLEMNFDYVDLKEIFHWDLKPCLSKSFIILEIKEI